MVQTGTPYTGVCGWYGLSLALDIPDARVLMNPLKGLRPLQKVHYSWPFGWDLQHGLDPDPNYAHGIFHDYASFPSLSSSRS